MYRRESERSDGQMKERREEKHVYSCHSLKTNQTEIHESQNYTDEATVDSPLGIKDGGAFTALKCPCNKQPGSLSNASTPSPERGRAG